MFIVAYFIAVCFKNNLVSAPEDGDITVPKRVEAV
jgi:hypothetical protein